MIPHIQQWLTEHHARLGVPADLQPLVLINVNYNDVESYPLISRVVLWFSKNAERPCLATKITDPGLTREALNFSISFYNKSKYGGLNATYCEYTFSASLSGN